MKPFRPCNGTEGDIFQSVFCYKCKTDYFYCDILTNTMFFDTTETEYPKEWVSEDDRSNPRCTAFKKLLKKR